MNVRLRHVVETDKLNELINRTVWIGRLDWIGLRTSTERYITDESSSIEMACNSSAAASGQMTA